MSDSTAKQVTFRCYTIHLPLDTASRLDSLVQEVGRSVDEILDEAFRTYDVNRILQKAGEYGASLNSPYTEEDVPQLIRSVRMSSGL